jgi:hypothetical protein
VRALSLAALFRQRLTLHFRSNREQANHPECRRYRTRPAIDAQTACESRPLLKTRDKIKPDENNPYHIDAKISEV